LNIEKRWNGRGTGSELVLGREESARAGMIKGKHKKASTVETAGKSL